MIDPTSPGTGRVVLTLLAIVAAGTGGVFAAQDTTTAGTATATALSSTWIAFEAPFTGDRPRRWSRRTR
jgi:hypothetical protein